MKKTYLEFEKSIESIETKIESLKAAQDDHPSIDINTELKQLEKKADKSLHDIYDNLSAWQISQVARHPQRPYTQDYINIFLPILKNCMGIGRTAMIQLLLGVWRHLKVSPSW